MGEPGGSPIPVHPAVVLGPSRTWPSQVGAASPPALGASGRTTAPSALVLVLLGNPGHAQGRDLILARHRAVQADPHQRTCVGRPRRRSRHCLLTASQATPLAL